MSLPIHKVGTRNKIEARREPYWGVPLATGRYLGVRKLEDGTCTWIARLRDDDGRQKYRSLGQASKKFDYPKAKEAAEAWFKDFDEGVDDKPITVSEACRAYVHALEAKGRLQTAHDAHKRFERLVYSDSIGRVRVDKLKTERIEEWQNNLGGAKSSKNRNLTALKAALNKAAKNKPLSATVAQQWRAVKAYKKADGRRTDYLDLKQRRRLLKYCEGAFRDLAEAAMLTGARPGELANLRREDLEERTGVITFDGKTDKRSVPLSAPALELFKRRAKDLLLLPEAYLLTQDDGRKWNRWDWGDPMREAVAKAKLRKSVVLYTLRHSFITEALGRGMTTLDVAQLTGTSLMMIQRHYGQVADKPLRKRLAKVTMV